jgi:hypothetical protein
MVEFMFNGTLTIGKVLSGINFFGTPLCVIEFKYHGITHDTLYNANAIDLIHLN